MLAAIVMTGDRFYHYHHCYLFICYCLQFLNKELLKVYQYLSNEMGKKAQLKCKIEATVHVWQEMSVCSALIISLNSKLDFGCQ